MNQTKITTFDRQLAERYYHKIFGENHPVSLSSFLPDGRIYNLMFESDDWTAISEVFSIANNNAAGIYTFWWLGTAAELSKYDTLHEIKGKKESAKEREANKNTSSYETDVNDHIVHKAEWCFNEMTLKCGTGKEISACPLYVGKSTLLKNRIRLHLQWPGPAAASQQVYAEPGRSAINEDYANKKVFKHTTASQFRDGFEYLFRSEPMNDRLNLLYEKIGITVAASHDIKMDDFSDRFYSEDLLIGLFRAPFNLDSER